MAGSIRALLSNRRVRGGALAAAVFGLMLAGQGLASSTAGLVKVRFGGDHKATRVVVELNGSATGKVVGDDPSSVVLDLRGVGAQDMEGKGQGLVRAWSADQRAGAARVKLDLTRPAAVKRRFLLPPGDGVKVYRYVIDLEATGAPPAPTTRVAGRDKPDMMQAVARPKRDKRVIVVDAGHGGNDPGTHGALHSEKTITLAAARELKARLERTGRYKVVLTRNSDSYVVRDTRVAIARRADADLFISLHADAGPDASLRGASVYTLSQKGADRAARRFMSRGDWFSSEGAEHDPAVTRILMDLTQRATLNRSSVFAKVLLDNIADRTALLRRSHRDAGFEVLLAPDVPAVLLEMGFMSNPDDERVLADPKRRGKLMDGVAEAVDAYFEARTEYASFAAGL